MACILPYVFIQQAKEKKLEKIRQSDFFDDQNKFFDNIDKNWDFSKNAVVAILTH